jgi:hypothetical protein
MKKTLLVAMAVLFAASLAVAKDCPGMKGKDAKASKWDAKKADVLEGEVTKVKDKKDKDMGCAMYEVSVKTADKGTKKAMVCGILLKDGAAPVAVGEKVKIKGADGMCLMNGDKCKHFCAASIEKDGKTVKVWDEKACAAKCRMMKGKKDDAKKAGEVKKDAEVQKAE